MQAVIANASHRSQFSTLRASRKVESTTIALKVDSPALIALICEVVYPSTVTNSSDSPVCSHAEPFKQRRSDHVKIRVDLCMTL